MNGADERSVLLCCYTERKNGSGEKSPEPFWLICTLVYMYFCPYVLCLIFTLVCMYFGSYVLWFVCILEAAPVHAAVAAHTAVTAHHLIGDAVGLGAVDNEGRSVILSCAIIIERTLCRDVQRAAI